MESPVEAQASSLLVSERPDETRVGQHVAYIEQLVAKGGPVPAEYEAFDQWLRTVAAEHEAGHLSKQDLEDLRLAFGEALSVKTLQGFSHQKPHGYTGDFEIIDRMYTKHTTERPHLKNWDVYFQAQSSPTAVRNRKTYFLKIVSQLEAAFPDRSALPVLNVASGPARDVFEFFERSARSSGVLFECVDNDAEAIEYAKSLCASYLDRATFHHANALRFRSSRAYQVIWSAGLFDYLGDKVFKFLLRHLLTLLHEDGELVVGNFAPWNPTKDYMEIVGDWHLYYRDEDDLRSLARGCGVASEDIRIGREPESVNLFLHIKKGPHFLAS